MSGCLGEVRHDWEQSLLERAFLLQQLQRVASKRRPCARPYTAWSVVDSPWPVHTLDASVVVLPGSGIEESHDACYYAANSNMSGCKQAGVQRVWMTEKIVSPENRLWCIPCASRLREEHRAEVIESVCIVPPVALLEPSDDDMQR